MAMNTPRLTLPLIAAGQAQKHVPHNEALLALDALVHLTIDERLTAPPPTPQIGNAILIESDATGIFAGKTGSIAIWEEGGWRFLAPRRGWIAADSARTGLLIFNGLAWEDVKAAAADQLGIGTSADATNRLAVASPAALFTHAGTGCQVKVNKAAAPETGSLLFQTNWSGRAEMGLNGSDDFSVKVSSDGSGWREGLAINRTSGAVRFTNGMEHSLTGTPIRSMMMASGGDNRASILRFDASRSAVRGATIASNTADILTLTSDVAGQFFHGTMVGVSYIRLWNTSKNPAQSCWIKAAIGTNALQVVDPAHIAGWAPGETLQLGDPSPSVVPTRAYAIDVSPMLQLQFGTVFRQAGIIAKMLVTGVGTRVALNASEAAIQGSFATVNSLSNGGMNAGIAIFASSVLSPISNSNLVFIREDDGGANTLATANINVIGVLG